MEDGNAMPSMFRLTSVDSAGATLLIFTWLWYSRRELDRKREEHEGDESTDKGASCCFPAVDVELEPGAAFEVQFEFAVRVVNLKFRPLETTMLLRRKTILKC